MWTWSDGIDEFSGYTTEGARAWARGLNLAVLPDIEVPKETG